MEERLKNYVKWMDGRLAELENRSQDSGIQRARLEKEKNELLVQIGFYQHERLVHLIVTVLFALLSMLALIWVTVSFTPAAVALLLLFFVLLVPYIRHYYILENGTQKLYRYYDRLEALFDLYADANKPAGQ